MAYGNDPTAGGDDNATSYGTTDDPMIGSMIGGVNVFGGGLALYSDDAQSLISGRGGGR